MKLRNIQCSSVIAMQYALLLMQLIWVSELFMIIGILNNSKEAILEKLTNATLLEVC